MKPSDLIRYCCGLCGDKHFYERSAEECCPREVDVFYECPTCNLDHDTFNEAVACCDPDSGEAKRINPLELEAAGQIRLIP